MEPVLGVSTFALLLVLAGSMLGDVVAVWAARTTRGEPEQIGPPR